MIAARVLAGGGSRGLAHLGVLQALDDMGIPVDVIGGTSQGAFMAALYAQRLPKNRFVQKVRTYASTMTSVRHLLSDLTLPILSVFSGGAFDEVRPAPAPPGAWLHARCCRPPGACLHAWYCSGPPGAWLHAAGRQALCSVLGAAVPGSTGAFLAAQCACIPEP